MEFNPHSKRRVSRIEDIESVDGEKHRDYTFEKRSDPPGGMHTQPERIDDPYQGKKIEDRGSIEQQKETTTNP